MSFLLLFLFYFPLAERIKLFIIPDFSLVFFRLFQIPVAHSFKKAKLRQVPQESCIILAETGSP